MGFCFLFCKFSKVVRAESESEQMRKFSFSVVGLVEIRFIAILMAYNSADKMVKQAGTNTKQLKNK